MSSYENLVACFDEALGPSFLPKETCGTPLPLDEKNKAKLVALIESRFDVLLTASEIDALCNLESASQILRTHGLEIDGDS